MTSLSIIVPALNESAGIARAVEAAWALEPCEVLVVDGGSTDDTAARATAAGATVLAAPRGRAAQQNAGAARATGEVLLFLHADCWLAPEAREQLDTALADPATVAGAFRQRIDAPGAAYRLIERGNAARARWLGWAYGDQGLFFRRATFERLGPFPDVPLLEDWLLTRKLRRHARLRLLPGPLVVSPRRWQRHGVVRQTVRNWAILAAALCGVPPARLAGWYAPHTSEADRRS